MLLIHIKADKKKIVTVMLAAILLIAGVAVGITKTVRSSHTATPDSAVTEQPAMQFLEESGYHPAQLERQRQITIPPVFNQTYEAYNALQQQAGFNLEPYQGKTAEMLVYTLSGDSPAYAVVLLCEGKVVGGHLTDGEYGSDNLPLLQHGTTG